MATYTTAFATAAPEGTNLSAAESYFLDTSLNLTDIVVSDIDSVIITATLTLSDSAAGSLSAATSGATTSTYNAGTGVWAVSGPIFDVNALLAGVSYVPNSGYSSNFTIETSVTDGDNAAVTGSKAMTFVSTNHAPVLDASRSPVMSSVLENAGAPTGAVGTQVLSLIDATMPAGGLDNVSDSDSSPLTGIAVTGVNSNLTCYYSINSGTTWLSMGSVSNTSARLLSSATTNRLYCITGTNISGTYPSAITFRAWDRTSGTNGATASTATNGGNSAFSSTTDTASLLVVSTVNSAPIAVDDDVTILQDTAADFFVMFNDTDPEDDTLSIVFVSPPTYGEAGINGSTISFAPATGFTGDDTFTYTITDPDGETDTATVVVHVVDSAAPTIESVSPTDGTIGSAIDVPLVITFSEPMETSTLVVSTSPCDDSCPTYDVAWSAGDTIATLTKSNGLFEPDTEYTVTVMGTTNDVGGNDLASDYTWSFSTYIPLVLAEVTPIPSRTTSRTPTFYFSLNEDVADVGEGQFLSESCNSQDGDNAESVIDQDAHTFSIRNTTVGHTYECSFLFTTTLRGNSNLLKVGPFTVIKNIKNITSGYMPKKVNTVSPKLITTTPAVSGSLLQKNVPLLTQLYKLKSTGDTVVKIQQALNTKNPQLKLLEDGKFGMKTFLAVKKFQAEKGVGVDGIVGNDTWKLLNQ